MPPMGRTGRTWSRRTARASGTRATRSRRRSRPGSTSSASRRAARTRRCGRVRVADHGRDGQGSRFVGPVGPVGAVGPTGARNSPDAGQLKSECWPAPARSSPRPDPSDLLDQPYRRVSIPRPFGEDVQPLTGDPMRFAGIKRGSGSERVGGAARGVGAPASDAVGESGGAKPLGPRETRRRGSSTSTRGTTGIRGEGSRRSIPI